MGKHKTPSSLNGNDLVSANLKAPDMPPETLETKVEKLEARVRQLEVLLNDVMHEIDNPRPKRHEKTRVKSAGVGKKKNPKNRKPGFKIRKRRKSEPESKAESPSHLSSGDEATLESIRDLLDDGKRIGHREVHPILVEQGHDFSRSSVMRCLRFLDQEGELVVDLEEIDGKTVPFVTKK